MSKPSIFIVGASHAKRLYNKLIIHPYIVEKYFVQNFTKSGSHFTTQILPNTQVIKCNDIFILWTFGNILFNKRSHEKRLKGEYKGQYVLNKFDPNSLEKIQNEWKAAKRYLDQLPCTVYILDCPLRYCLSRQIDYRIIQFQRRMNCRMNLFFQGSRLTVLPHFKYLPVGKTFAKDLNKYQYLFADNVHFSDIVYAGMVTKLIWRRIL